MPIDRQDGESVKVCWYCEWRHETTLRFLAYRRFSSRMRGSSATFFTGSNFSSSVRSSGRWKVSLISSGVFPSIIRAKALLLSSTRVFISRLSAALVSSHNRLVSSLMNFSSKIFRSYKRPTARDWCITSPLSLLSPSQKEPEIYSVD